MGAKSSTFSTWKKRGTIPDGAVLKYWRKYNYNFDVGYVISGHHRFLRSVETLRDIRAKLAEREKEYNELDKIYSQALHRLGRLCGPEVAEKIFSNKSQPPEIEVFCSRIGKKVKAQAIGVIREPTPTSQEPNQAIKETSNDEPPEE